MWNRKQSSKPPVRRETCNSDQRRCAVSLRETSSLQASWQLCCSTGALVCSGRGATVVGRAKMTALQLKELSHSGLYRRRRDRPDSLGLQGLPEQKLRWVVVRRLMVNLRQLWVSFEFNTDAWQNQLQKQNAGWWNCNNTNYKMCPIGNSPELPG